MTLNSTAVLQREPYSEPTLLQNAVEMVVQNKPNAKLSVGSCNLEEIFVATNSLAVHREAQARQGLVTVIAFGNAAVEVSLNDRQSHRFSMAFSDVAKHGSSFQVGAEAGSLPVEAARDRLASMRCYTRVCPLGQRSIRSNIKRATFVTDIAFYAFARRRVLSGSTLILSTHLPSEGSALPRPLIVLAALGRVRRQSRFW